MSFFSHAETMGHEQVVYCYDVASGLKAIIAIHDTTLGPALGGTRLWPYENEAEALRDVLRLSRGMTYKSACAGLSLGGGKAVIIADPRQKSEALFRAFGRFVDSLGGRYITAEDVNTKVTDMDYVRQETRFVTGVSPELGGSGDPSPVTALGVYHGLRAGVEYRLNRKDLRGLKVAVQGVGNVGKNLCRLLAEQGAKLYVNDVSEERLKEVERLYGATIVGEREIYGLDVDVFSPNALGAILNNNTIPLIKAPVICGGSNNQLEDEAVHARALRERKIAYCPDYVVNAGGITNVYNELIGYNRDKAMRETEGIFRTTMQVLLESEQAGITTHEASQRLAERRIKAVRAMPQLQTRDHSPVGRMQPRG